MVSVMDKVAIYLRLSKEDDLVKDESNSIANQRDLIMDYIRKDKKLRKLEVIEFKDDGYSGKNMNRPGIQQLLESVRKQQVKVIIVKDLSRFSRDYLVIGQYTEQIFPFMGIRFIAINDTYDSSLCEGGIGEIDVAFKALLYDFYSEDLSQKVKSAIAVRKEQGKFMNTYAPYGYKKCENDRYMLEIEPKGAEVVRRIFSEYASGKGMLKISAGLNSDGIDAPAAYIKKRDGKNYFREKNKGNIWSAYTVSRILRNEIYGGTAVINKAHARGVGSSGGEYYPKEEWKRIENVFPALIDPKTYQTVWKKLDKNKVPQIKNESHVLKGKVYCGNCGYCMMHTYAGAGTYYCNRRFLRSDSNDCVKSIRDSDLEEILLLLIREKISNCIEMREVFAEEAKKKSKKIELAKRHLRDMQQSYDKIDADLFQAYESYRAGISERETYLQQKETYEQMLAQLQKNLECQNEAIDRMTQESTIPDGWNSDQEYLQIDKLDRNFVELFVKKIIIYNDHSIEVVWNFKQS